MDVAGELFFCHLAFLDLTHRLRARPWRRRRDRRALQPYDGLATRRLQSLGHFPGAERDTCPTRPPIASAPRPDFSGGAPVEQSDRAIASGDVECDTALHGWTHDDGVEPPDEAGEVGDLLFRSTACQNRKKPHMLWKSQKRRRA
jgi:hypothetical protein